MSDRRPPFWLWPNLLSLDAPLVAVVWLYLFAKTWGVVYHPWHDYVALWCAVWGIYLLDRLLDVHLLGREDPRLAWRHRFHAKNAWWMGWLAVAVLGVAGFLALKAMPANLIGYALFRPGVDGELGYLAPGLGLVGLFFCVNLASMQSNEIPHFRNLIAGLAFSYGTAMVAHVYRGTEHFMQLLLQSQEMWAFALLCALNISAIHFWEKSRQSEEQGEKAVYELALTLPLAVLALASLLFARGEDMQASRPFFYSVLTATALLFWINRNRSKYSLDALRVMADLAMIAPLPIFLVLSRH